MRILLAEDEIALAGAIATILEKGNFSADVVHNGEDALIALETGNYDAAVLDIMMPKLDGISVLRRLREVGNAIPILLLSAKSEIDDKVFGLDCGANDYLAKPFDARELLARLRTITRGVSTPDSKLTMGNLTLDRAGYLLSSPEGSFRLANRELQIMEMLMSNPGSLISAERLLEKIWGSEDRADLNVVWVYISYLRKKMQQLHANVQIKASRNAGYTLEALG